MLYCKKVFPTFLGQEGIESEIIDLLQGRIPNSMFVKHYYRQIYQILLKEQEKRLLNYLNFLSFKCHLIVYTSYRLY